MITSGRIREFILQHVPTVWPNQCDSLGIQVAMWAQRALFRVTPIRKPVTYVSIANCILLLVPCFSSPFSHLLFLPYLRTLPSFVSSSGSKLI